ncbi:MAG TPA: hypothetical protein VGP72_00505 [Planctomycetota bacterium]|jgi:hypothetical protein
MGHQRLGSIPTTRKFDDLVGYLGGGSDVALADDTSSIARQTLDAVQQGLSSAHHDYGLCYAFYLLSQIVLASRESNWQALLENVGIQISAESSVFDFCAEVQNVLDDRIGSAGRRTDISEMAQQALGESLSCLAEPNAATLFGRGQDELQSALRQLSTKNGFARLGQKFFGLFTARYINFFLSRTTAAEVGGSRLNQLGDLTNFETALRLHCEQSAFIVRDFCGDWYAKTQFQEGIDLVNTTRFVAVAIKKLRNELKKQGAEL